METKPVTYLSGFLSFFKYLVGVFMMFSGVATIIGPLRSSTNVGSVYETAPVLITAGTIFFISGAWLVLAKALHKHKQVGYSLMAVYLCFLFAAILNWLALGPAFAWPNFICALVMGALYLRWKHHLLYSERVDRRRHLV